MESGSNNSAYHYTDTFTKDNEEPASKRNRALWCKEDNWKRLKKLLEILRNPTVVGVCDEGYLELGEDPIPQMTVANVLKMIGRKPITYNSFLPLRYQAFLS